MYIIIIEKEKVDEFNTKHREDLRDKIDWQTAD